MDKIRFECPHCSKMLGADPSAAGRRFTCPGCQQPVVVPETIQAPKPAPPPEPEWAAPPTQTGGPQYSAPPFPPSSPESRHVGEGHSRPTMAGFNFGKYLFMGPLLRAISSGGFFRRVISTALWVVAVFFGIGALVAVVAVVGIAAGEGVGAILGALVADAFLVVGAYMIIHTLIIRARDIANLPESEFTVVPILAVLIRAGGEVLCWAISISGVASGLLVLFSRRLSREFLGSSGAGAAGALVVMLVALGVALFILVFSHMLAELTVALSEIAKETRRTRQILERTTESG